MHPNSLKNLEKRVPWKPGQPGNPKGLSLTKRREMMLDETCPLDEKGRDWRETLAEDGLIQAHSSPYAMNKLQDRLEGKVPDKVDVDVTAGLETLLRRLQGRKELPEGEG